MNITIVLRTPIFLKNFAAGIQELTARGHQVEVVFSEPPVGKPGENLTEDIKDLLPSVTVSAKPAPKSLRVNLTMAVATALDVLRYDGAVYDSAPKLRTRARGKGTQRPLVNTLIGAGRLLRRLIGGRRAEKLLRALLDAVPASRQVVGWLKESECDLLIVSPLTSIGTDQAAWVLAARAAKIRVLYSMYSWDNLTNKGLLRPHPDAAIVWNETHRTEAMVMHGMPAEAVHCTGAPGFDIWFDCKPTQEAHAFRERVGLNPGQPYILYTCSSIFIGKEREVPFVQRWLAALRSSADPAIANLGVLLRPHPQFAWEWSATDFSAFGNVVVYPKAGAVPFLGDARSDYFDSIHHSSAVIGINTSAMVEAAIIDRPVITIADPGHSDTQDGTLHFRHLKQYGFLIEAGSIAQSLDYLSDIVGGKAELVEQSRQGNQRFVADYIRPGGVQQPAAPIWAEIVDAECRKKSDWKKPLAAILLAPVALAALPVYAAIDATRQSGKRLNAKMGSRAAKVGYVKGANRKKRRIVDGDRKESADPESNKTLGPAKKESASGFPVVMHKTLAMLRNDPPKPKDIAQTSGPYKLLKNLAQAYEASAGAPPVLVLGDSVYYRVSRDDLDRRRMGEMLQTRLAEGGFPSLLLNSSAYHPGIYAPFVEAAGRMPAKPAVVVMPINLRCFSPQWWLHPDHEFAREIELLQSYRPGDPIGELDYLTDLDAVERYDETPVSYPDSPLETIGQFRLTIRATAKGKYQEMWRARQIAIFHYLHLLAADHPRVVDSIAMIEAARKAGIIPLVYLTPINHMHGVRVVGERFATGVAANVETLLAAIMPALKAADGTVLDWSRAFSDMLFFTPDERTEHLNVAGRQELARRVADAVKDIHRRQGAAALDEASATAL